MTRTTRYLILSWLAAVGLLTAALREQALTLGVWETSLRWRAAVFGGGALTAFLAALPLLLPRVPALLPQAERLARRTRRAGAAATPLLPLGLFLLARHPYYGTYLTGIRLRLALLWLAASACALWLAAGWPRRRFTAWLGGVLPFQAGVYALAWFFAPVSRYPLSLGWSEASRYYYASLFLSPALYGFRAAWPALHPSRYLLQAAPFLFGAPLWAHRAWQAFLWTGLTLAAAWAATRRLQIAGRWARWTFWWGAALFILQAPVYYHLLVAVILVLWGVDFDRPRRTWAALLAASLWAGISRVNWFPVPAVLTAVLYFLERPQGARPWWRYWAAPLAWGALGTGAALLSQAVYAAVSGNPPQDFGTSFTSDLLWYRLLPNPTFPQGVLPMALAAGLPALAWIAWGMRRARLPFARWFPLLGLTLGLFAGGLVVSVKIGGGNNLHNLDAWFVTLLLWGGYLFWGRAAPERAHPADSPAGARPPWGFAPLLLALPLYAALSLGQPRPLRDLSLAREAVNAIRRQVEAEAARGGEVLFISERHLLTFGAVDAPLIPEYERTFLMEMAMAHNETYLAQFRRDLAARRFALIVVQPLNLRLKGRQSMFGEENDAWVQDVAAPVLCYYEPVKVWRKAGVQLMRPRAVPEAGCP